MAPPPDDTLIHNVVQLDLEGMSRRAIARALKVSRNTVSEILRKHGRARKEHHSALPQRQSMQRASKLDAFRAEIEGLFAQFPDITAQRIFEILQAEREDGRTPYDGGYTVVKDLVRRIRPKPHPKPSLETAPREPGAMAECDWSPYPINFTHAPSTSVQAFGYTLRYSTRKYYSFHEGNGLHPLMDGHVNTFRRFNGAAKVCRYDSQKPVVLRWEGGQPIYNPRFIDFATYYEFRPEACRRGKPNDKPRVERSFWELDRSFLCGRRFRDPADLKAQLTQWLDTIADPRPLKRMRDRTRLELFAEEQPLLRPLPQHPYDTARVLYRLCDIEGFIAWENNWYSLPYEYVTEILPVRITESELFIYKPDLTCIARHALLPRGAQRRSILQGHRPRNANRGPDLDQLRGAFADLGDIAVAFLVALEKREHRSAGHHARRVLSLRERYGTADLVEALSHALAYGALEHAAVERILIARAKPRRLDEYVAEQTAKKLRERVAENNTEPRDLAEYDALPSQHETADHPGETPCPEKPDVPPTTSENGSNNTSSD